jgi:uncharacterized protein
MTPGEIALVAAAGLAAGTSNTIVGAGSLITFPTLLALGLPPVVANVTNTVGLVPGSISGALGYRPELRGQGGRMRLVLPAAALGGLSGAALLLLLPGSTFELVVPYLILVAVGLVAFQERIAAAVRPAATHDAPLLAVAFVYLAAIYGGYFGAAQGVILVALLGLALPDALQRTNAAKNLVAVVVNGVAAVVFVFVAAIRWDVVLPLSVGAVAGGILGARVGRRLRPAVLRAVIIVVGTLVAGRMLLG